MLTPALERSLAMRQRSGDLEARRRMIEACLPFVHKLALKYRFWGAPVEDLVQEGAIGLLKAVDHFDPDRGCRLTTYAALWIRAALREYVARNYRMVRLGTSKGERRALRAFRRTREEDPVVLAELSGLTADQATALLPMLISQDMSLERWPSDDRIGPSEWLHEARPSPEERVCAADESAKVNAMIDRAVSELPERDRRVLEQRFLTDEPETLERLGVVFGVSQERVRQIESRAKDHVRRCVEAEFPSAGAVRAGRERARSSRGAQAASPP